MATKSRNTDKLIAFGKELQAVLRKHKVRSLTTGRPADPGMDRIHIHFKNFSDQIQRSFVFVTYGGFDRKVEPTLKFRDVSSFEIDDENKYVRTPEQVINDARFRKFLKELKSLLIKHKVWAIHVGGEDCFHVVFNWKNDQNNVYRYIRYVPASHKSKSTNLLYWEDVKPEWKKV